MAEDAVALYGLAKKQLESMNQREAELQGATAALQAAVAELKGLPFTLGKQTSQYIGMGVREAIQQDFDNPHQGVASSSDRKPRTGDKGSQERDDGGRQGVALADVEMDLHHGPVWRHHWSDG